jgi:predicted HicB family RNase H-like nuclease
MSRNKPVKPYWEMTAEELANATKEFDKEFVADKARPLTAKMRRRWERARAKSSGAKDGTEETTIAVRLEKRLLARCTALAKRKRISRDALIARGLKALLAAEGRD